MGVTPGIIATDRTVTDEGRLWAGHLLGGPRSALGGAAALFLEKIVPAPSDVEVWVPNGLRKADRPGWTFSQDGWGRLDRTLGTLPRIRAEEALLDMAQTLDVEGWVTLLAEAVRLKVVALPVVLDRLDARPKLHQRSMVRDVVLDLSGLESTLEWVYLTHVERAHGLPAGRRQVTITWPWRCDVHLDDFRLIIEVDGRHHLRRVLTDLDRDNDHAFRDEATVRYGSAHLRGKPCKVAWQLGGGLARRGWMGEPHPCPRCPGIETRRAWYQAARH